jgi:hypothetical protein
MLFAFDDRGVPSEGKFMRLPSPTGDNGWNVPNDTPTDPRVPAADSAALRWEACANDGGTCNVPGVRRVRFGANGSYAYREVAGAAACSAASFGADPAVGAAKRCEFETALLRPDNLLALEPAGRPSDKVRHGGFLANIAPLGAASNEVEWAGGRWAARRGLADAACYSFESTDWPGYFLRHQGWRLRMQPRDGTALFNGDATFCARAPLNGQRAGGAVSLESKNNPGHYLRHVYREMSVALNPGTAQFAADATFLPVNPRKPLSAGGAVSLQPSTWPGFRVRHAGFQGFIAAINAASPAGDLNTSAWMVRPGLADAACHSFESRDWPGHYLRHENFRIGMAPRSGGVFDGNATFCPRAPLTGLPGSQAVSLEALSAPGHFILHRNFELWIAPDNGTEGFKTDATFVPFPA